jgi:hypothetical protein
MIQWVRMVLVLGVVVAVQHVVAACWYNEKMQELVLSLGERHVEW